MDFFLTDNGPVLNEVNTMPGMTAESPLATQFSLQIWPTEPPRMRREASGVSFLMCPHADVQ